jgi:hypothetical protein
MLGSLSTEQSKGGDQRMVTDSVLRDVILIGLRPTYFLRNVRSEMWSATHAAKVKAFLVSREQYMSSDNFYTIILPRQVSFFFKHRSLEDALFSPDAPLEQPFTNAAVCSVLQHTTTENGDKLRL